MADLVLDNERRREVSDQVGLSFGKIRALRRIASRPMPMRELAALLGVDPPNLTTVVDDLERVGPGGAPGPSHRPAGQACGGHRSGAALAQQAEEILDRPPVGLFELPADDLETWCESCPASDGIETPVGEPAAAWGVTFLGCGSRPICVIHSQVASPALRSNSYD